MIVPSAEVLAADAATGWSPDLSREQLAALNVFAQESWNKAAAFRDAGEYEQATDGFYRFTLEFGESEALCAAVYLHADCLRLIGNSHDARMLYRQLIDCFPADLNYAPAALYQIGSGQIAEGRMDAGHATFMVLLDTPGYGSHPLADRARARLTEAGITPQEPLPESDAAAAYAKATRQIAAGDIAGAYRTYREIEVFFPRHAADAIRQCALLAESQNDLKRAIAEYRRLLYLYDDPFARTALGRLGLVIAADTD